MLTVHPLIAPAIAVAVSSVVILSGCAGGEAEPSPRATKTETPALTCAEWIEQEVSVPDLDSPQAEELVVRYQVPASTEPALVTQAFMASRALSVKDMFAMLPTEHDTITDCIDKYFQDETALAAAFGIDRLSQIYVRATVTPQASNYAGWEAAYSSDNALMAYNTLLYETVPIEKTAPVIPIVTTSDLVQGTYQLDYLYPNDYTIGGDTFTVNASVDPTTQSWMTATVN